MHNIVLYNENMESHLRREKKTEAQIDQTYVICFSFLYLYAIWEDILIDFKSMRFFKTV